MKVLNNKEVLKILPFKTEKNQYIYDGISSEVIPSSYVVETIIRNYKLYSKEEIFIKVKEHISQIEFEHKYEFITGLINQNMFYEKSKNEIKSINIKDDAFYSNGSQLILVVTGKCNLRCEYCIYSDKYPKEMTYSEDHMNFETAKSAIDEFFDLHKERVMRGYRKPPFICFYGGEPLINFKLINQVVDYVKTIDISAKFYITTNGILLTEKISKFLIDNNFYITFSIDGYKENHDRNRVTVDGRPTFDNVVKNIRELQEYKKDNNIIQQLNFNCCCDDYTNIYKCIEFFEENYDVFNPFYVTFSQIDPFDTTYFEWIKKSNIIEQSNLRYGEYKESLNQVKKIFLDKNINRLKFKKISSALFIGHYTFNIRNKCTNSHFNNSCTPLDKLAVYPDGTYALCEKMNGKLPIGTVSTGINFKQIELISNRLRNNLECGKCALCPIKPLCPACFMFLEENGEFKKDFCKLQLKIFKNRLKEIYSLGEKGLNVKSIIELSEKTNSQESGGEN